MAEARHTGGTFGVNSPAREALARLLIEKGVITQREFLQKIAEERATYQKLPKPTVQ
jgi:hypothetical protein